MAHITRSLHASLVIALFIAVSFGAPVTSAQKPPKATIYPTVALFSTAFPAGIRHDGRGPYYDGVDGVSSTRVAGSTTTNGWAFDLKASRATQPRLLIYDLSVPYTGPARGVISINDTHGQIYDLSDMAVGEVKYVRAAFHLMINRVEYVLRFGQTPGDGSSALQVTREANDAFHVRTSGQGDLARYLQGNGPGEVLIGVYHLPVDLMLTNQ